MSSSSAHAEQCTSLGDVDPGGASEVLQLVVTSPGHVDMHGLIGLAKAMKTPVSLVSKAVYQAPSVLMPRIQADAAPALVQSCAELGLEVEPRPGAETLAVDLNRFDLAIHITDASVIPPVVEIVARMVGVDPEQAYQMVATPPGLILGAVSTAAARAVKARLPEGATLSMAQSGSGPFDLFVPPEAPNAPSITAVCGAARGLVALGLDKTEAESVFARLPKGTARLVARDLIACDLVLHCADDLTPEPLDWLRQTYGVDADIGAYTPLALEEGLSRAEALDKVADAAQSGLTLVAEPAGFDRCAIEVTKAADMQVLARLLSQSGQNAPQTLPAIVARNLPDLDARWLAHQLERIDAQFLFVEERT